jgi:hypothetical protein
VDKRVILEIWWSIIQYGELGEWSWCVRQNCTAQVSYGKKCGYMNRDTYKHTTSENTYIFGHSTLIQLFGSGYYQLSWGLTESLQTFIPLYLNISVFSKFCPNILNYFKPIIVKTMMDKTVRGADGYCTSQRNRMWMCYIGLAKDSVQLWAVAKQWWSFRFYTWQCVEWFITLFSLSYGLWANFLGKFHTYWLHFQILKNH